MTEAGALQGVRVLDAGLLVQGPFAGQLLSDMGADVVKVEMPGVGDYARWVPAADRDRRPPWFIACNRGKRSLCLDLRTPRGGEVFLSLCEHFDVVISNFTPGTLESWGLGYEAVAERNPRIIYASASAYGTVGEKSKATGLDLGAQAASGLVSVTGPADDDGYPVGATIGDHIGSLNLAIGILGALFARERTGRGQQVSTSLLGSLLHAQAPELTAFFLTGRRPRPAGRTHPLFRTLYGVFRTRDGGIVITRVPETRRAAFWTAVGQPRAARIPAFNGALSADAREEVLALLDKALAARTTSEWCEIFRQLGVEHAPVRDYPQVEGDGDVFANGYLQKVAHPAWGTVTMPGNPVSMSRTPTRPGEIAPALGEHTAEVLSEFLDMDETDIAELRRTGTV